MSKKYSIIKIFSDLFQHQMVLIIGASGAVGIPLIKELVARGSKLKALTSNEASAKNLQSLGVMETIIGNFRSDNDVDEAMTGATSVCYIPARFKEDEFEVESGL